ncbi:MAG TPA: hypothetical protein VFW64_02135 [Pseudonocardiaceae bacterium]|nr:hypothetical protein [Pseudonocardiaceae bacterium]
MTLIILTVVVIALLIATLAVFLFAIGVLLNRIADNLDDCLGNVKTIAGQADAILPGVGRINQTGGVVAGALPLLVEGAESIVAKVAFPKEAPRHAAPAAVSAGVGYLDT